MPSRFLDPMARVNSRAARKGGMRDDSSDARRMKRLERVIFGGQSDDSGEIPDDWSMMEEVNAQPTPTADIIGRMFLQRNTAADDVLSVGITAADGTPILVGLTTQSPDGETVALSLEPALASLSSIHAPVAVVIDSSANLHVVYRYTTTSGSEYGKYNSALTLLTNAGIGSANSRGATTDNVNFYHTGSGTPITIYKRTMTGGLVTNFGTTGTSAGQLQEPYGIASNATHLFVTDRIRNKVIKFTLAGVYVSEFGATGSAQGQFSGPTGVTLDTAGNIYVCDTGNNRIQQFNSAGTWLQTFGGVAGNADGQLNAPEGLAVDDVGNLWIADTGNNRIQVIDASGVYVAKVGSYGSGASNLNTPRDIALGDGYGYVADDGNKRIVRVKVAAEHTHTNIVTTRTATSASIANGATGSISVSCLSDEICTGGGYAASTGSAGNLAYYNFPSGNGWNVSMVNTSGAVRTITAYAQCLKKVI